MGLNKDQISKVDFPLFFQMFKQMMPLPTWNTLSANEQLEIYGYLNSGIHKVSVQATDMECIHYRSRK